MKLILLILLFSTQSWALSIQGTISHDQDSNVIVNASTGSDKYLLKSYNSKVMAVLRKLQDGDYLCGQGDKLQDNSYSLDVIDFVGLKQILGVWKTGREILKFQNFNKMSFIFYKDGVQENKYSYTVAPITADANSGTQWKIFFTSQTKVDMATLELDGDSATIYPYNHDTGETEAPITLKKVK